MGRERNVLAQIIKNWAQDHDYNHQINSLEFGDSGVDLTSIAFTGLVKETEANIDLLSLLDRLELYVLNVKNKRLPDGMFCCKCQSWCQYAEPNQPDGTLLCYSCLSNPYH